MASRRDRLRRIALDMVAEGDEPTFYQLVSRLQREVGASHEEANRTVLELLHRGSLSTTFGSRIALGRGRRGDGNVLATTAAVLGIVGSILGIWEVGARNGVFPGPGPIGIVFPAPTGFAFPTPGPPEIPLIPTGAKLAAPTAALRGDCQSGFTLTWGAIDGAESYRVEQDGNFRATVRGTELTLLPGENARRHRYTVAADALLRARSDPSNEVTVEAC